MSLQEGHNSHHKDDNDQGAQHVLQEVHNFHHRDDNDPGAQHVLQEVHNFHHKYDNNSRWLQQPKPQKDNSNLASRRQAERDSHIPLLERRSTTVLNRTGRHFMQTSKGHLHVFNHSLFKKIYVYMYYENKDSSCRGPIMHRGDQLDGLLRRARLYLTMAAVGICCGGGAARGGRLVN